MDKTEVFWDKQASKYDESEKRFDPVFNDIISKTKQYLTSTDIILDYGCATGKKTLQIAVDVNKVYGIDISSEMINEAKNNAKQQHIDNVDFSQATIFDNDFNDETFDVITAYGILHLMQDSKKVVQKIHSLLKPGGLFISTTACLKEKMTMRSTIEFSLYRFIKKLGVFPLHFYMLQCSDVYNIIKQENFEILKTETILHGITISFIVAKKK